MIPEIFKDKDTVFHYCKTEIAIEYILASSKLRLSPRSDSDDPIENTKPFLSYSSYGYNHYSNFSNPDVQRTANNLIEKIKHTKQLCLCMNDTETNYSRMTSLPLEYYGFLKPRMWDQYGDKYKGICLALSLKELIKKSAYFHDRIRYITYNQLKFNNFSIDINDLIESGFEEYNKKIFNRLKSVVFRKHVDYNNECEYRFCSFSNNNYDYIDIESSIVGIIISEKHISDKDLDKVHEFSRRYEVEVIGINWNESGVYIYPNRRLGENPFNSKINNLNERINLYRQQIKSLENLKQYGYLNEKDIIEFKLKLKALDRQMKILKITSEYSNTHNN